MAVEETRQDRYYPHQPYVDLKERTIREVYVGLPLAEKAIMDDVINRVLELRMRGMGRMSALEIVGSIAIKLAENPQLK